MQRFQAGDLVNGRASSARLVPHQANPFETLEHSAHGWPIGEFADLIGHRLGSSGQLLAQAVLCQPVDQQAQHHDQRERHDAARLLHKDRGSQKQRILEEGEAALYEQLVTVSGGQDVFPTFNDVPTSNSPAWMVILQGTGPTANAPGSPRDDTAYFIDPFSGNLKGSVNLPPESEANAV